jgi:hypothetical protein
MNRIKISPHFYLDEIIDPVTHSEMGEKGIEKIDPKLIDILEYVRTELKKGVIVNTWATGGQYKESGLRNPNTTTGAKRSAHKEGKAVDVKIVGMDAANFFDWCIKHKQQLYNLGVREIEDHSFTPTWTHLGTRGEHSEIKIIKP